jgi:hypothetical protein
VSRLAVFSARSTLRFLRYTYPALLLTLFFEEVSLTVNAAATGAPYWFETYFTTPTACCSAAFRRDVRRRAMPSSTR